MRRAVKAALKNGQLEEIFDADMLSCWSVTRATVN